MPDAARYAGMSDPDRNFHFSRGWDDLPPPIRERRLLSGIRKPAEKFSISSSNTAEDSLLNRLAQRARSFDRAADGELALGHHAIAERLARLASDLREVAR